MVMKKIEMYKPGGKGKETIPKTIFEISEELEDRLKSQGIKPDSSFLSSNFKTQQKNAFPTSQKVSGTLSVGSGEINAFLSLAGDEESELKGRMFITQYKIENGKTAEAFEKASAALKVLLESFWVSTEEKQQSQQKLAEPTKTNTIEVNGTPKEVAKYIQKALEKTDVAKAYEELQRQAMFYPFIKFMNEKIIDNYMFMGLQENNGIPIYMYKNSMNREYIRLDDKGNFYDQNGIIISRDAALVTANEPVSSSVALNIPMDEIDVRASHELIKQQKEEARKIAEISKQGILLGKEGIDDITGSKQKTITIPTGAKALNDDKILDHYSKSSTVKNYDTKDNENSNKESNNLKSQLINVNFTPEQAEVVIQLLEENQKKYEPKSSMFGLLGDVVGKMLQALSKKLDQMIDAEKLTNEKLNSIYSAINNENYELFVDKYKGLEQKIKYCHDIICEAAQGQSIQSTNIINHILNKEKVPVSIRTLQNAFVTAIDNNIDSALSIYKYADSNLHGEAHFDTIRGFLSHALNTLPDNEAEKFINVSSIRAFDDTVIFKEMIRAEKYGLLNSSLQHCNNIDEHAPSLYYFAAQRKNIDTLHILASKGANVNENNTEALYTCFETNKPETAKILVNFGADIQSLKNRIEQIQRTTPNYTLSEANISFLNELYKYSGLGEYTSTLQQNQIQDFQEDVHGENGDLGVHDGSWE